MLVNKALALCVERQSRLKRGLNLLSSLSNFLYHSSVISSKEEFLPSKQRMRFQNSHGGPMNSEESFWVSTTITNIILEIVNKKLECMRRKFETLLSISSYYF